VPQEEGPNQDSELALEWETSDTASNDAQTRQSLSTCFVQCRESFGVCVSSQGSRATHLTAPSDTFSCSQIVAQHR